MMDSASVVDAGRPALRRGTLSRSLRGGLKGGEYTWALAFVVPYIAVFVAFVAYPVVYGLWMGSQASLYRELFADPIYQTTVVNTILYLALGVNVYLGKPYQEDELLAHIGRFVGAFAESGSQP
jgi:multiple sugar transport system permease protein